MELTKLGHACVRATKDGRTLVLDPGIFTPGEPIAGAEAVLVTHEHPDHLHVERIRQALAAGPALHVWANAAVAAQIDGPAGRVTVVGEGDTFSAAGFEVSVHGQQHAVIHPDIPRVTNAGFLLDGAVFHPGDALTVPEVPVETLLLPVHAPWNKFSEVLDYVRAVSATRAYAIHDVLLSDVGLGFFTGMLNAPVPGSPTPYERLEPGTTVTV